MKPFWMWGVLAFWTGVVGWSLFREEPKQMVWRWDPGTGWQIEGVRLERWSFGIRVDDFPPVASNANGVTNGFNEEFIPAFAPMQQERTFNRRGR